MSPRSRRMRLLIAATSFADAQAALRLAERLGTGLASDLLGLMVEETEALALAQLPGRQVVTQSGRMMPPPAPEALRRMLDREARAFEQGLARLAEAQMLRWSFRREGGELVRGVLAALQGGQGDLLILGQGTARGPLGAILALGPEAGAAAQLARQLGKALGRPVEVLDASDPVRLPARLARRRAAAVVIGPELLTGTDPEGLRALLGAARCPVLLLRDPHPTGLPTTGQ
ncbi:MAG: hypothetical protein ACLFRU_07900 [Paracoccaceae bacterium]